MQSKGTFYTQDGVCMGSIEELKITNTVEDSEELPELIDFTIPGSITFTGSFEGNLNHIIYTKAERKIWNLLKTAKSKRLKKKQIKRYFLCWVFSRTLRREGDPI